MLQKFIDRPVLSTVIAILTVILGVIGLSTLPLQQFPDIAPPAVQVVALYPGANAETVLRSVAPSLEEAINGVENMSYMSSTASNDGSLVITVNFKLGTNPDQAAVNVQNRVSQATSQLPQEVVQAGISTTKQQNSLLMVVDLLSENEKEYDQTFLANYAQINIIPDLKRIPGVGQALIFGGSKDYSLRVWLNPAKMANYNLTPKEVMGAIKDKNLEAAPGRFGESSNEAFEYVLKYKGKLNKPEQYENIVIRSNSDGSVLRLKDVARIELGSYTYSSSTRIDGKAGLNIAIYQLPGSNSSDVQIAIKEMMNKASKDFPKDVKHLILYNTKDSLDLSIAQVKSTLIEAFILVFIVVFLFLQDIRATLIPAIAVPVSILGTFFFMQVFGFSINLLTLFALVLAIGIVVDDAIVVVEAVHEKMHSKKLPAKAATTSAMSEITGAIISITLVMSAVFLPVGFMEGSTGVFYRQFAFTLAIAIVISAVNAFREVTPDSLQYLIDDMFENITVFSNRVTDVNYVKSGEEYEVTLTTFSEKFRADSLGKQTAVPLVDFIDIGIFGETESKQTYGKPLVYERLKITKPENTFTFKVKEKPQNAGIDPYNYLVDRMPEDNVKKVTEK